MDQSVHKRFIELADRWERDNATLSSVDRLAQDPICREIVAMGWTAVPWIIRELVVQSPSPRWFVPLVEIVGTDHAVGASRFDDAVKAWIRWARNAQDAPEELREELFNWSCTCSDEQIMMGGCVCTVSRGDRSWLESLRLAAIKLQIKFSGSH